MGNEIIDICRRNLIELDVIHICLLVKAAGARWSCPRCYVRTLSGETLTRNCLDWGPREARSISFSFRAEIHPQLYYM